jgi:hypothetical protein
MNAHLDIRDPSFAAERRGVRDETDQEPNWQLGSMATRQLRLTGRAI